MNQNSNTICAISTPSGMGGVAIIRISGSDAFPICQKIFRSNKKDFDLTSQNGYTIHFGHIVDDQNSTIDEVLISIFNAPHSFTGENVVEISCHGSIYIQQQILQLLLKNGAVLAQGGEFTMRAFLNGKMDLSQAEAVADMIASTNEATLRMAINQMRGGFSEELREIRSNLLHFVSMIELELDFSEEEVEFADRLKLNQLAQEINDKISTLIDSFSKGNVLKNGVPVALVGETNVGKSTLLNYLLNDDKAIVSDIHGTTRDVIEDTVNIDGITFRFIDTAGIRKTTDVVENLGIERTYKKIEQSEIVLWIIDCTQVAEHIEWLTEKIAKRAEGKKIILIFNKIDKLENEEKDILNEMFERFNYDKIYISAKNRLNTEQVKKSLIEATSIRRVSETDVIVTNVRHYEALQNAQNSLKSVLFGLDNGISGEFLSRDIRDTMHHLGTITGEITTDEILGNIFKNFCVGK